MPGLYDSSITRVTPVFDTLCSLPGDWIKRLLQLPEYGSPNARIPDNLDLNYIRGWWGEVERGLLPPISLLSWLIRHPNSWAAEPNNEKRQALLLGDPAIVELALKRSRSKIGTKHWSVLEGHTYPDVVIETQDSLIVIEGKRTERGPTTHTTWMSARHQMWRHIDTIWEIKGRKRVYGFFIVEGNGPELTQLWQDASINTLGAEALSGSFPHRSDDEISEICSCFLGITTWGNVCEEFDMDYNSLPNTIHDV